MYKFQVLSLYKQLCKTSQHIVDPIKKINTLQKIKESFHLKKDELNPENIQSLLKKGNDTLSYLKATTPKLKPSKNNKQQEQQIVDDSYFGVTKFIKVDGEWKDVRDVEESKIQKREKAFVKESTGGSGGMSCPPGGCGRCSGF
ncbi:hypothetical protein ABK040_015388 [Willaertia magna]